MIDIREHGGIFGNGSGKKNFYDLDMEGLPYKRIVAPNPDHTLVTTLDDTYSVTRIDNYYSSNVSFHVINHKKGEIISSTGAYNNSFLNSFYAQHINDGRDCQVVNLPTQILILSYSYDSTRFNVLRISKVDKTISLDLKYFSGVFNITVPNSDRLKMTVRTELNQVLFWNEYKTTDKLVCVDIDTLINKTTLYTEDLLWSIPSRQLPYPEYAINNYIVDVRSKKCQKIDSNGNIISLVTMNNDENMGMPILASDGVISAVDKSGILSITKTSFEGSVVYRRSADLRNSPQYTSYNKIGCRLINGKFIYNSGWKMLIGDYKYGNLESHDIIKYPLVTHLKSNGTNESGVTLYRDFVLEKTFTGYFGGLELVERL